MSSTNRGADRKTYTRHRRRQIAEMMQMLLHSFSSRNRGQTVFVLQNSFINNSQI